MLVLAVTLGGGLGAGVQPACAQTQTQTQTPSEADRLERIAAVVNEEAVSTSDVLDRLRLALLGAGLPPTEENQRQLLPQVVRTLVDERLQRQEAERLSLEVPEAEIEAAMADVAGRNGMTLDQFRTVLTRSDVSPASMRQQIESQLLWREVVRQRIIPSITITEEEIDERLQRQRANAGQPEWLLAEIFVPVEDPLDASEVQEFVRNLVQRIRGGASFPALARQFSRGAGAAEGGDLGWVTPGQLQEDLEREVRLLNEGEISAPIRTLSGFHILLLRDVRTATPPGGEETIRLARILRQTPPNPSRSLVETLTAEMATATERLTGCDAALAGGVDEALPPATDLGLAPISQVTGPLQELIAPLAINEPSEPVFIGNGVAVFIVCDRRAPGDVEMAQQEISEQIMQERAGLLQRRYLRDLRTAAFIDVRI